MKIAERLGAFSEGFNIKNLSENQITKIKLFFLDWIGSAIAGSHEKSVRIVVDTIEQMGGTPSATIIPTMKKSSPLWAALANGASSHVVEMDDLHRESILHPATAIIPAVFAAAESVGVSGSKLIEAVVVGYEIAIRIALGAGPDHYFLWHTTGTCGTFGSAAGAAKIMNLSAEQTAHALGSAGTQASGLWEFLDENAMSKQLHAGKAAFNGYLAAQLANCGFTGAIGILEGKKGFWEATSPHYQMDRCLQNLGNVFHFERNSLKHHASCGHTHSAIDALLIATKGEMFHSNEIKDVTVHVYQSAMDVLCETFPTSCYLAKFSMQFCMAAAIRFGKVSIAEFTPSLLEDEEMRSLMSRVQVMVDPEIDDMYPALWPARVELKTVTGELKTGMELHPKGDPENFPTEDEVIGKFMGLTQNIISLKKRQHIILSVMMLEKLEAVGMILNG